MTNINPKILYFKQNNNKSYYWKEKYFNNWRMYFGNTLEFKIGITIGLVNNLYLGKWVLGISR